MADLRKIQNFDHKRTKSFLTRQKLKYLK